MSFNFKDRDDKNIKFRCQDAVEETSEKMSSTNKPDSFIKGTNVLIMSGPYKGTEYIIHPRLRKQYFIGRSTGKKLRDRGITLPEDYEVPTTHGKFIMKIEDIFCHVDTGSTNFTLSKGAELKSNDQLEMKVGLEITVEASVLKITFRYEKEPESFIDDEPTFTSEDIRDDKSFNCLMSILCCDSYGT